MAMKNAITANVEGVELVLCASDPQPGDLELWTSWGGWDGPNDPAPISVWPQRIKDWRIAKQVEQGFEIWDVSDERPKYWGKRAAVMREGSEKGTVYGKAMRVLTRNGKWDPDNLYGIEYHKCAMDTPEAAAAIEEARRLHAEAVEALHRFKDAAKAIPRMTNDDWRKLSPKPGDE